MRPPELEKIFVGQILDTRAPQFWNGRLRASHTLCVNHVSDTVMGRAAPLGVLR